MQKGSISTFQEFFARAGKILISGEGLSAMQQFYEGSSATIPRIFLHLKSECDGKQSIIISWNPSDNLSIFLLKINS